MKTWSYKLLIIPVAGCLLLLSCQNNRQKFKDPETATSPNEYREIIQTLMEENLWDTFDKELDMVNHLKAFTRDTLSKFRPWPSYNTKPPDQDWPTFSIETDTIKIAQYLQKLTNNLTFTRDLIQYDDEHRISSRDFSFDTNRNRASFPYKTEVDKETVRTLNYMQARFHFEISKYYSKGKEMDPKDIGLTAIDSIAYRVHYTHPVKWDKITIPKDQDEIAYQGKKIKVIARKGGTIDLDLPYDLYRNILEYLGCNAEGIHMHPNMISPSTRWYFKDLVKTRIDSLYSVLQQRDLQKSQEGLAHLSKQVLQTKIEVQNLYQSLGDLQFFHNPNEHDWNQAGVLLASQPHLLKADQQLLSLNFTDSISKLELFAGVDYKDFISQTKVAINAEPHKKWNAFRSSDSDLYGIVDDKEHIIIPAQYAELSNIKDTYFFDYNLTIQWLDKKHKVLKPIEGYTHFWGVLKPNYAVVGKRTDITESNTGMKLGVVKGNEEIIPPIFSSIYWTDDGKISYQLISQGLRETSHRLSTDEFIHTFSNKEE